MADPAFTNPSDADIAALLRSTRRIAVVGASDNPRRPSHEVADYLLSQGYAVVPVNPQYEQVLGQPCQASLSEVAEPIDLVDVFRAPEHVAAVVDECIELGLPALWLQEGVIDAAAAERARAAGLTVVMDRCMLKEHRRLAPGAAPD